MSKPVAAITTLSLLMLAACEGGSVAPNANNAPAELAEADLSSASCDQNELFVKQGLAQDMRDTLGAAFVVDYRIKVPGALIAYDSYGGDMIQTVLGASASAAQVFAVNPGGPFSGALGGSVGNSSNLSKRGLVAAKALFDAMSGAVQTSSTDQGWTTTTRTSKGGRFACELRVQGGVVRDGSCSFKDLLMLHTVSWTKSATDFCVR